MSPHVGMATGLGTERPHRGLRCTGRAPGPGRWRCWGRAASQAPTRVLGPDASLHQARPGLSGFVHTKHQDSAGSTSPSPAFLPSAAIRPHAASGEGQGARGTEDTDLAGHSQTGLDPMCEGASWGQSGAAVT